MERALVNAHKAGDTDAARKIAQALKQSAATPEQQELANPVRQFAEGAMDPIHGGAQMLSRVPGAGMVNRATAAVNELPVIGPVTQALGMTPATSGELDARLAGREKEIEAARTATGRDGINWPRLVGNMTTGITAAAAGPTGLLGNVASGAGFSALTPVTGGDYATEKTKQVGIGAATSGALYGLGKLASGAKDKFVEKLTREGIRLTPGQASGSVLKAVEDRLTSLPIVGDAIKSSRRRGMDEFNKAAYRYALEPIGETVDDMPVGREAIAAIGNKLNAAYDEVLPLAKFKPDGQFAGDLRNLAGAAGTLPPEQQSVYKSVMVDYVLPKVRVAGDGKAMKEAEEVLGKYASNYAGGQPADRQLASLFREARSAIRENLIRSNPTMANRIRAIDEGWKAYDVITQAGLGARAAEGFTPNALSQAVKATNKSFRKRGYSRGEAFMQDLSDAAQMRLPSEYPDSGTAGRMMLSEMTGIGLSPLAVPYLPGVRNVTSRIATQGIPGVGAAMRGAGAAAPFSPGLTPSLYDILYKPAPESD